MVGSSKMRTHHNPPNPPKRGKENKMVIAKRASEIPEKDTSYMIPWRLDMLYEIEPKLRKIADGLGLHKRKRFYNRIAVYERVKNDVWELVGWGARDPRLRSSGAWNCYFNFVLRELRL